MSDPKILGKPVFQNLNLKKVPSGTITQQVKDATANSPINTIRQKANAAQNKTLTAAVNASNAMGKKLGGILGQS